MNACTYDAYIIIPPGLLSQGAEHTGQTVVERTSETKSGVFHAGMFCCLLQTFAANLAQSGCVYARGAYFPQRLLTDVSHGV